MAMVPNYKCPPIKNRVNLIIANKTEAKRQKMWFSWQSGHFQYQRTTVQIQSSAKNYIDHVFTVTCSEKTKLKKKRPEMAHFFKKKLS